MTKYLYIIIISFGFNSNCSEIPETLTNISNDRTETMIIDNKCKIIDKNDSMWCQSEIYQIRINYE